MLKVGCTTHQALCLYDELVQCYHGTNGYSGNTAEVYVYTMMEHSSLYTLHPEHSALTTEIVSALEDVYRIVQWFQERYTCEITLDDGVPIKRLLNNIPYTTHRLHLTIERED